MLESAIAYLRPDLTGDEGEADVVLSGEDEPVLRSLGNGMLVAYLLDQGDRYLWVQQKHLRAESVTAEELHEQGVINLARKASGALRVTNQGDFFACFLDGDFEASLLLVDNLWESHLAELVANDFVVGVPARDILMFCDSESERGIAEIENRIERVWPDGDHLLRRELYRRTQKRWQRYLPNKLLHATALRNAAHEQ